MGSYGRNFEFRVPPHHGERAGRFYLPSDAAADLPIGVPVKTASGATPSKDFTGALPVALATGAQAPVDGLCGIALYEHAPAAYAGFDPLLTTHSDIDKVPRGKLLQVISGEKIKVVFKNTITKVFLHARTYPGRMMVAGIGATPTVQVGDYLTPGTGDDTSGYWAEGNAGNGWLIVTNVDVARAEVECRMTF